MSHPEADRLICGTTPPDPETAREWWSDGPYGIACRTGVLFDALQVPRWLGRRLLPAVEHHAAVIELERTLELSWLFLVTPGAPRIKDLPRAAKIHLHGADGWIVLPPTTIHDGRAHWVNEPSELRFPPSLTLQWSAIRAVNDVRHEIGTAGRSRFLGTIHRPAPPLG